MVDLAGYLFLEHILELGLSRSWAKRKRKAALICFACFALFYHNSMGWALVAFFFVFYHRHVWGCIAVVMICHSEGFCCLPCGREGCFGLGLLSEAIATA